MLNINWLNQISETTLMFIAGRSIDVCIAFAVVAFIWLLIRQRSSAKMGYCLFLLVLLKLMVPGFVSLPMPAFYGSIAIDNSNAPSAFIDGQTNDEHAISTAALEGANLHTEANVNEANGSSQTQSAVRNNPSIVNQFGWQTYIFVMWFIGVFCFLAFIIRNEFKTWRWIHNTKPIDQNRFPVDIAKLQSKANVSFPIKYQQADWVQSPLAYGILSPTIVLTADLQSNFTKQQIEWIILHEIAHLKNRDPLVSCVQRLLQALFFFHPIVWWTNHIIDTQREYVCDDFATSVSQVNPIECGEGLLGVAMQNNGLPTFLLSVNGITKNKTYIRRRMMRILEAEQSKVRFNTTVILLTLGALILPFNLQQAVSQETIESNFSELLDDVNSVVSNNKALLSNSRIESEIIEKQHIHEYSFDLDLIDFNRMLFLENVSIVSEETYQDGITKGKVTSNDKFGNVIKNDNSYDIENIHSQDGKYHYYKDEEAIARLILANEIEQWVITNDDKQIYQSPNYASYWINYLSSINFTEEISKIMKKDNSFVEKNISSDGTRYKIGIETKPEIFNIIHEILLDSNKLKEYVKFNPEGKIDTYLQYRYVNNTPKTINYYSCENLNNLPRTIETITENADKSIEIQILKFSKQPNITRNQFDYKNYMENGQQVLDYVSNEYFIVGDESSKQPLDRFLSNLP